MDITWWRWTDHSLNAHGTRIVADARGGDKFRPHRALSITRTGKPCLPSAVRKSRMRAAFSALALGACLSAPPGLYAAPALPLTACGSSIRCASACWRPTAACLRCRRTRPRRRGGRSACTSRGSRPSAAASSPTRCSCWPAAPGRRRAPSMPRRRPRLRARPPRPRHRARRPARHRQLQRRSTARTTRTALYRASEAEVAAATRRCLAALGARADGRATTPPASPCGSGARARRARLRAHQSLRRLVRHARRAALPAAFPERACAP